MRPGGEEWRQLAEDGHLVGNQATYDAFSPGRSRPVLEPASPTVTWARRLVIGTWVVNRRRAAECPMPIAGLGASALAGPSRR